MKPSDDDFTKTKSYRVRKALYWDVRCTEALTRICNIQNSVQWKHCCSLLSRAAFMWDTLLSNAFAGQPKTGGEGENVWFYSKMFVPVNKHHYFLLTHIIVTVNTYFNRTVYNSFTLLTSFLLSLWRHNFVLLAHSNILEHKNCIKCIPVTFSFALIKIVSNFSLHFGLNTIGFKIVFCYTDKDNNTVLANHELVNVIYNFWNNRVISGNIRGGGGGEHFSPIDGTHSEIRFIGERNVLAPRGENSSVPTCKWSLF